MTDKEKITELEKEIKQLRERCWELEEQLKEQDGRWENIFRNKQTQYMELLADMNKIKREKELVHNARGAGRKTNYEKRDADIKIFAELYEFGYSMSVIMSKMNISRTTFYRIKKSYLKRKERSIFYDN